VSTASSIPPFHDWPSERLAARRQHLLSEIQRIDKHGVARSRSHARRKRHQPRVGILVAVAVVLAAAIATPAFGLRDELLHLFGRGDITFADSPPAASVIKREFADMSLGAPKGMDPRVASGQARLAGTFAFGGVKRHVWVAPTESGGFCYLLQGISGGCTETESDPIVLDGGFYAPRGSRTPAMNALAGRIFAASASRLTVTFEDGRQLPLPFVYVSEPIGAGFFAYKPTSAEERPGHRPLELVLTDAGGAAIARETINWANEERKLQQILDYLCNEEGNPRIPACTAGTRAERR
jgi:hypothetical protein